MKIGCSVRRTVTRGLGPVLIAGVVLAGCAEGPFGAAPTFTPGPAEELHLPGVTEVGSVYAFLARQGYSDVTLTGSALLPDETGVPQPYLTFMGGHDLHAVRPDGSDLHRIFTDLPCSLPHVGGNVSSDGQWLPCRDDAQADLLWTAHLSPHGQGTTWTSIAVPTGNLDRDVAWSPNGRQVAAPSLELPCAISLYDVPPAHVTLRLAKTLALPELAGSSYCALDWLGWSPDGRHLALSGPRAVEPMRLYVVDLTNLPAPDTQIAGAPGVTLSTTSTPTALRFLGADRGFNRRAAWTADGSSLLVNQDVQEILLLAINGTASHRLLHVPFAAGTSLCDVGSVARTTLVAFTYCYHRSGDLPQLISGPGERLYVFDPAAA